MIFQLRTFIQAFSVLSEDSGPTGVVTNNDESKIYICGINTDFIYEYDITPVSGVFTNIGSVGTGIVTFNDTSAPANVELLYRVKATRFSGDSNYSNVESITISNILVTLGDSQLGDYQLNDLI